VATGALLDDADHAKLSAAGGQGPVVLDFGNGAEQSRPETMLFAARRATLHAGRHRRRTPG
jgi:hypothetical protein